MPQITGLLTTSNGTPATGISAAVLIKDGVVRISGTFVATVQVEVDAIGDGTYASAMDSTGAVLSLTVPGVMRISNGLACNVRLTCTAYTSGTVAYAVRG